MKNMSLPIFLILALAFAHEANAGKIVGTLESANGPMVSQDGMMDRELESEDEAMPIPVDLANGPMDRQLDTDAHIPLVVLDTDDEQMEAVNRTMDGDLMMERRDRPKGTGQKRPGQKRPSQKGPKIWSKAGTKNKPSKANGGNNDESSQATTNCKKALGIVKGGAATAAAIGGVAFGVTAATCVATFGIGCPAAVSVAAVVVGTGAGMIPDDVCGSAPDSAEIKEIRKANKAILKIDLKIDEMKIKLNTILDELEIINYKVEFTDYTNKIHEIGLAYRTLIMAGLDEETQLVDPTLLPYTQFINQALHDNSGPLLTALQRLLDMITGGTTKGSIYAAKNLGAKSYFCQPAVRQYYNLLFLQGYDLYFKALAIEGHDVRDWYKDELKKSLKTNKELAWKHCNNAQCTLALHSHYGLSSETSADCCNIKQDSSTGVRSQCGQLEGPCYDENDCLDGYTCSQYVNSNCWNLAKNGIVQVFPKWGDLYKVEFEITVTNVNVGSEWINILHFTAKGDSGDGISHDGDRIPAVWINTASSYFYIVSRVNGNRKGYTHNFNLNTKYHIKIKQTSAAYEVIINDASIVSIPNSVGTSFPDVTLYASDPWTDSFSGTGSICNVKIYSGEKDIPVIVQPQDSCIEEDTDFEGNDLPGNPRTDVPNPTACRTLCLNNNNCNFWTYGLTAHSGNCWLKSSDSGRKPYSGLIAGRKKCDLCLEKDTDFQGHDLPGNPRTNVANPTACQKLCLNNNNCNFWTYGLTAPHSGNCWLKSTDSGRQSYPGLISGRKNCNANMCSICPSGTHRVGNECRSCSCMEKGTESCDTSSTDGECICNSKAVSGSQNKCEIFSCHDDSDCTSGVCWRPKETTWTYYSGSNYPADKIELKFSPGSAPAKTLSFLAGTYILAPEIVNKATYWDGAYWISANGKYAIWYCNSCQHVDYIIGQTSKLGGKSGYLTGWDGCGAWNGCELLDVTDWQYVKNGKWVKTDGISITPSINLKESEKGRCVDCSSCTWTKGCTGCNKENGWLPLQ
jgi:hypothetical protein